MRNPNSSDSLYPRSTYRVLLEARDSGMELCSRNHSEELLLNEMLESNRQSSFFRVRLSERIGKTLTKAPERKRE